MQVHILIPYSLEKNLGKAYNEAMQMVPEGDSACLIDYDVQLLTPDAGKIIHDYAEMFPDALLTCYTNRKSDLYPDQLLEGKVSDNMDHRFHIERAIAQREHLYKTTPIHRDISGFLMLVNKNLWRSYPFDETGQCIGVDTKYGRKLRIAGKEILRMDGLYVFHAYRIMNGVRDKSHLQ